MRRIVDTSLVFAAALAAAPLGSSTLAAQAPPDTAVRLPADTTARPARDSLAPAITAFRDSTEVDSAARRYAGAVRTCYQEQGLKADPALRGLLRVELTVLPTGGVQGAAATTSGVSGTGMPAVAACIATAARAWRFSDGAPGAERVVLEFSLVPPTP